MKALLSVFFLAALSTQSFADSREERIQRKKKEMDEYGRVSGQSSSAEAEYKRGNQKAAEASVDNSDACKSFWRTVTGSNSVKPNKYY